MEKFEYAEKVVKKVKNMLKHDNRFSEFFNVEPIIEVDGKSFGLNRIAWNYYEYSLIVMRTKLMYCGRNGGTVIMTYRSFDDLLSK